MSQDQLRAALEEDRRINIELTDVSQDEPETDEEKDALVTEVMSVAEATKRINQLKRFMGKVKARKKVYENLVRQEYSVSDNVQNLVNKALEELDTNTKEVTYE